MDVKQLRYFLEDASELRPIRAGAAGEECWNTRTQRRVRAILPVHLLGLACAMDELMELARQYRLVVIEDAAEAIGVRYRHLHVGTWGHLGVFSFNGNKTVTCGGGGMLVAHKPYADYARYLATQARDDAREYYHKEVGYNYRLTNVHAAIGLAQLERAGELVGRKRAIAAAYQQALRDVDGITLMPTPAHTEPGYWLYTILLKEGTTVAQRNAFIERLAAEGLEARPLWQPIHTLPPYQSCDQAGSIEVAPDVYTRAVSLPSSARMTDTELERCVTVVRRVLAAS
jgi:perosamine synthetase